MLGKMRHRVRVESRTRAGDGMGGAGSTWNLVKIVWAYMRPKTTTETSGRDRIEDRQTYLFTIRYMEGFVPSYRIVYNDETYNVVSVKNMDERDKYMEIEATKGTVA